MSIDSETQKKQEREYTRWQGYANALLVALTVLFAGTAIAFPKSVEFWPILSAIFGLLGIVLTVVWHAFEYNEKTEGGKIILYLSSGCFGLQVVFLFYALYTAYRFAITTV